MTECTDHARHTVHRTARLAELLDLLFEQSRHDAPNPLLPAPQLRAMGVIDGQDHIPMRTLAHRLGASPPSVCRLIDRLQAAGFVQRHPHPDSGREVTLTLTPAGRVRLARVREGRENLLHQALQGLPEAEHTALSSALDTLHRALTTVRPHLHALPADTTTSAPLPGRRIARPA
ncbi:MULTISPECIES: MarR family winged helix-turn-helix transcriptional regulator [Streptomyces]|uniref:MarR family winged helix-turn-helix transcriptional regulator n=1 Tax=Streptomyces TaxID=1883 RepID=UPI001E3A6D9B|nr:MULTISPECIES: MarR family transcriptional regulator [Streptomyces]UFQ14073.1 MarR family transcriptional regulator [Streptomyces huasconensis]WCL83672.1 MarR family transcriptional regulator [Streptomyces sp. JCM 35825]